MQFILQTARNCWVLVILGLVLNTAICVADELVPVPAFTGHVVDTVGLLKPDQRLVLESQLSDLQSTKGSQIVVLIVETTAPETIEQYAIRAAESWKIGRKGTDDGVLMLIAVKDRAVRLEVGYGFEGAISDIVSKRIIEEIIVPQFKAGDFNRGIVEGVAAIMKVIGGEKLPQYKPKRNDPGLMPLFGGILIGIFVGNIFSSRPLGVFGAGTVGLVAGTLMFTVSAGLLYGLIASLVTLVLLAGNSRGTGGIYRGGGTWRGGFGGGISGGFSGGLGGSFGGGGASGRW